MLCVIRNRIRLSWVLNTARNEPGNYVGDFLVRHRLAGHVASPVGRAQLRTSSNHDGVQPLIADQREKRIISNGAAFWSATARTAAADQKAAPLLMILFS